MKFAVIAACFASVALAACRREEPSYVPMKLGAEMHHTSSAQ